MNRLMTLAAALLVAIPLAAAEGDQTAAKKKADEEAAKKAAAAKTASQPTKAAPAQEDSPLVAAAKRSKRLGKNPTNVITNETVDSNKNGGHVSTADTQAELPVTEKAPERRRSMAELERDRILREKEAKRLAEDVEAKRKRFNDLQAQAAESLGIDEDPAAAEAELEAAKRAVAEAEKKQQEFAKQPQ